MITAVRTSLDIRKISANFIFHSNGVRSPGLHGAATPHPGRCGVVESRYKGVVSRPPSTHTERRYNLRRTFGGSYNTRPLAVVTGMQMSVYIRRRQRHA